MNAFEFIIRSKPTADVLRDFGVRGSQVDHGDDRHRVQLYRRAGFLEAAGGG